MVNLLRSGVLVALLGASSAAAQAVDATTLDHKVLLGYQGWFDCPSANLPQNNWSHWSRPGMKAEDIVVDMYPDLTEFDPADLCALPGFTVAGKPAYLYSAWSPKIVDRHFRWMKEYGLDGVLVQRFLADIPRRRATGDVVLKNILAAAKAHGRVFAIEYDVSGAKPEEFFKIMSDDWQYLVHDLKITTQPGYLHHKGKPLLSITLPLWLLFVLSFFGLVVVLVARRSRIIGHFLEDEIHMGNLSRADVRRVCHPFGLFLARLQYGDAGVEFLRAAARLGLSKWHYARASSAKKLTLSADFIVPLRQQLAAYRKQLARPRAA